MTQRLNRQARQHLAKATIHGQRRGWAGIRAASRPSPTEHRRALHLSRAKATRHARHLSGIQTLRDLNRAIRDTPMAARGHWVRWKTV
jgi:hypothetical protein